MKLKRGLLICLCFLLLFSFGLRSFAETRSNKNQVSHSAQNAIAPKDLNGTGRSIQDDEDCNT